LHFAAILGKSAFDELHCPRGNHGDVAKWGRLANGLRGSFHFREPAAIGANGGQQVVFEFELDATERVAAAFVIRGEDRSTDQFAKQPG
jgi:hypothetical protein